MIILNEKSIDLVCYISELNSIGLMPKTRKPNPCIYIFSYADTRLKIGVTSNLKSRMRDHSTLAPDFTMQAVIYFDTLEKAKIAELKALTLAKKYAESIGVSEVFALDSIPLKELLGDITEQYTDTHEETKRTGCNY